MNGGLTIENLGRTIDTGDAGALLGGGLRAERRAESMMEQAGGAVTPAHGTTFA